MEKLSLQSKIGWDDFINILRDKSQNSTKQLLRVFEPTTFPHDFVKHAKDLAHGNECAMKLNTFREYITLDSVFYDPSIPKKMIDEVRAVSENCHKNNKSIIDYLTALQQKVETIEQKLQRNKSSILDIPELKRFYK